MPDKILTTKALTAALDARRARGERIVFTNGCFDLLHVGHTRYLQEAKKLGDCLVVGLNSDASVRAIKPKGRPLVPQAQRAEVLAALACVGWPLRLRQRARALGPGWAPRGSEDPRAGGNPDGRSRGAPACRCGVFPSSAGRRAGRCPVVSGLGRAAVRLHAPGRSDR